MRTIICGAGLVGYSIADYLSREGNDVTIIDIDKDRIEQVSNELDVNAIHGHAPSPETLKQAGATDADMLIAVTHNDEVNMIACQVAHSLFNVPKKIARIRDQTYVDPAWSNLFSRTHMPIDLIISPEIQVAQSIVKRLSTPGTTNIFQLAESAVSLIGVMCDDDCPLINTQMRQLRTLFPDLPIVVCLILRGMEVIVPSKDDQMLPGDEVYFFTDAAHVKRALSAFGHNEKQARNIVIFGGGNVGLNVAQMAKEQHSNTMIKIIESDGARAQYLSEILPNNVVVLHGDGLQEELIREAHIGDADTLIAVTNDDETNILGSLLAKQYGCKRVITLINNPTYTNFVTSIGIDAAVSPRASTVSTIMKHVRRGRVKALHAIRDGAAEIIEVEVSEASDLINMSLEDFDLPDNVMIGMIVRDGNVMLPKRDFVIQPKDHIIIMAKEGQANKIEDMFTVQVDLF